MEVLWQISLGRDPKVQLAIADSNEFRKRIMAILLSADPLVLFDDTKTKIEGDVLDPLLTSKVWTDRKLKENTMLQAENRTVWTITGNNLMFSGDTGRRILLTRLSYQPNLCSGDQIHHAARVASSLSCRQVCTNSRFTTPRIYHGQYGC